MTLIESLLFLLLFPVSSFRQFFRVLFKVDAELSVDFGKHRFARALFQLLIATTQHSTLFSLDIKISPTTLPPKDIK